MIYYLSDSDLYDVIGHEVINDTAILDAGYRGTRSRLVQLMDNPSGRQQQKPEQKFIDEIKPGIHVVCSKMLSAAGPSRRDLILSLGFFKAGARDRRHVSAGIYRHSGDMYWELECPFEEGGLQLVNPESYLQAKTALKILFDTAAKIRKGVYPEPEKLSLEFNSTVPGADNIVLQTSFSQPEAALAFG